MLEPPDPERATTWVAPPILFTWLVGANDPGRQQIEEDLNTELARGAQGNTNKVAHLIRTAITTKQTNDPAKNLDGNLEQTIATVDWKTSGGISGSIAVVTQEMPALSPLKKLVQVSG